MIIPQDILNAAFHPHVDNEGGPAFPVLGEGLEPTPGMMQRAYFAARAPAMPGFFPRLYRHPIPKPVIRSRFDAPADIRDAVLNFYDSDADITDLEQDVPQAAAWIRALWAEEKALAAWEDQREVAMWFAWPWFYADRMLATDMTLEPGFMAGGQDTPAA